MKVRNREDGEARYIVIPLFTTLDARQRQGKATEGSPEGKRGKDGWRRLGEQEKGGNRQGEAGGPKGVTEKSG